MKYQKPKGTKDILPNEIHKWHFVENTIRDVMSIYNFSEIRTPTFEHTDLFKRSVGTETDVVGKEMYTFNDKNNESITLRPEMTASVMRAYLENGMNVESPLSKLFYIANMFRYEKPQAGRYREHTQFGAEIIGSSDINSDIEIILLAQEIFFRCGIKNFIVKINSIGKFEERSNYISVLKSYLKNYFNELSEDSKRRYNTNPLRILDSKDRNDIHITNSAPKIVDHLTDTSRKRFESVIESLRVLNLNFEIDFRLVRGFDYYTDTTFEFISKDLGAQNALGGGGRYDGLIEIMGGNPTPGIGFASGLERLIIVSEKNNFNFPKSCSLKIYFISLNEQAKRKALFLMNNLRTKGITCESDLQGRSMKSQMREANRMDSEFVYIIGEEELKTGKGILKNMSDGTQVEVAFDDIAKTIKSVV